MTDDVTATLLVEHLRLMRRAIELAVENCPEVGIDVLCDYFAEANAAECDPELQATMDRWWEFRRTLGREDPQPPDSECQRCAGCGQIANDEDGTPWTYWANLPARSALAVQMGLVRPLECPNCKGTGKAPDQTNGDL